MLYNLARAVVGALLIVYCGVALGGTNATLYLRSTATNGVGGKDLISSRGASAYTESLGSACSGTCDTVLQTWYSTGTVTSSVTLNGTVTCNLRGAESHDSANNGVVCEVGYRRSSTDTSICTSSSSTEWTTSESAKSLTCTASSVGLQSGDRLYFKWHTVNVGTGSSSYTISGYDDGPTASDSGDSYITLPNCTPGITDTCETVTSVAGALSAPATMSGVVAFSVSSTQQNPSAGSVTVGRWASSASALTATSEVVGGFTVSGNTSVAAEVVAQAAVAGAVSTDATTSVAASVASSSYGSVEVLHSTTLASVIGATSEVVGGVTSAEPGPELVSGVYGAVEVLAQMSGGANPNQEADIVTGTTGVVELFKALPLQSSIAGEGRVICITGICVEVGPLIAGTGALSATFDTQSYALSASIEGTSAIWCYMGQCHWFVAPIAGVATVGASIGQQSPSLGLSAAVLSGAYVEGSLLGRQDIPLGAAVVGTASVSANLVRATGGSGWFWFWR